MFFILLNTKTVKGWLQEDEYDMDVDIATSGTQTIAKHSLPELEIYCYFLVLIFLIDQKIYNEVTWLDKGPFFFNLFPPPKSLWFLTLLLISLRLKLVPCLALFG